MTIKEMFKKVEAYNEVAEIMGHSVAKIYFEYDIHWGEKLDNYSNFSKYIRREFIKELGDVILRADDFEMDKEITKTYTDRFGKEWEVKIGTYLVS